MIRANVVLSVVFTLAQGAAWAQVGAPLLGYLPNGGHIQPIYGVPAAAGIAPALNYGRDFELIAVSPLQDFSLVSDASSGAVLLALSTGTTTPLPGVSPRPDRMVLSPSGSAAALWFSSSSHLQIVSGLPASPTVRDVDASFLGGGLTGTRPRAGVRDTPATLAVSDDGQWMVGAWSKGLYAFGPQGEVAPLTVPEPPSALAFFAGRQDLAIASAVHIYSITGVGGANAVSTLYTDDGLNPVGLAVSSDNARVVLAQKSGILLTLNLSAGSTSSVDCGCTPEGVFPMGRALFRLTGINGGAFKLLDASRGEVLLVPLGPDAQAGGRQ